MTLTHPNWTKPSKANIRRGWGIIRKLKIGAFTLTVDFDECWNVHLGKKCIAAGQPHFEPGSISDNLYNAGAVEAESWLRDYVDEMKPILEQAAKELEP